MKHAVVSMLLAAFFSCAMEGFAAGQDSQRSDSAHPTLDELKAAGALRSSYLKQQSRSGDTEAPKARLAAFRKDVEPVLKKACVECHGPETQEGNIRLDTLDPDLLHGDDVNWWLEVVAVLSNGEMPPADATELADKDRSNMIE